jgi:hypothetical protein
LEIRDNRRANTGGCAYWGPKTVREKNQMTQIESNDQESVCNAGVAIFRKLDTSSKVLENQ